MFLCMCGGNHGARLADLATDKLVKGYFLKTSRTLACSPFPVHGGECDERAKKNGYVGKGEGEPPPVDFEHCCRVLDVPI
jgi:hypothetical protein